METQKRIEFVKMGGGSSEDVSRFLELGRAYLAELNSTMPVDTHEKFLQSMLQRQSESDRWLLLLKCDGACLGFVHAKIDRDERPGWGYILEYFVIPTHRKLGWGARMAGHIMGIFSSKGVKQVWLESNPNAEGFWRSVGFVETGVIASNNKKVMIRNI